MNRFFEPLLVLLVLSAILPPRLSFAACNSDGLIHNPDGSISIKNPQLLRGDQALRINGWSQGSINAGTLEGTCKLFGFSQYLSDSVQYGEIQEGAAILNTDGTYNSVSGGNVVSELTCYNSIKLSGYADQIVNNPDNSVTFRLPKVARGDQMLPINAWSQGSINAGTLLGTCKLFGFTSYLQDSIKYSAIVDSAVILNENGTYNSISGGNGVQELSCFNEGALNPVGEADGVIHYRDGNTDGDQFHNHGRKFVKDGQ